MSLDQRLNDPVFLENVLIGTIEETVKRVSAFTEYKKKVNALDEAYQSAEDFLSEYRRCAWTGEASGIFISGLKDFMVPSLLERWKGKTIPYTSFAIAGFLAACYSITQNSFFGVIFGMAATLVACFGAYRIGRQINNNINNLQDAVDKHPNIVNKALKYLYEHRQYD
jgi:hypothetical protein